MLDDILCGNGCLVGDDNHDQHQAFYELPPGRCHDTIWADGERKLHSQVRISFAPS